MILAKPPPSSITGRSASRWHARKPSLAAARFFSSAVSTRRERHDADPSLSVFRRPLRRGARVLQEEPRRRGRDADAFQGFAREEHHVRAGQREQGDALILQARRL